MVGLLGSALLLAGPIAAQAKYYQQPEFPIAGDEMLLDDLPEGANIEVRLDKDINGDGIPDVACIGANDEQRWLLVKFGFKDEFDWGYDVPQINKQLGVPLGPASLSVKKNVLVVEDLTGGTTATNAVYRYRWDAKLRRLQLIGLDAQHYSRTNTHDSFKLSWNLLTGTHETQRGILNEHPKSDDDEAYFMQKPVRTVQKTKPVYVEDTPDPDALIDAEMPPAGEDRD